MDTNALNELVEGILAIFNTQVIRIVLYGSYARGTNTSESDVDVALLLNGNLNESTEDKLSDLIVDLNLKYDKVFSVIDIDYAVFKKWEKVTPFYKNVSHEQNSTHPVFMRVCEAWQPLLSLQIYSNNQLQMV